MADVLNGGVLLARLPKGLLGEEAVRLLGSFLVASVWQAASARVGMPEDQRIDCSLVLDECAEFPHLPYPLEDMLAEARAYRLSLVLAHQNLAQFPADLREGVSANARCKVFFSVSPEDARSLERHTKPTLLAHDLSHLGGFQAAARLVADRPGDCRLHPAHQGHAAAESKAAPSQVLQMRRPQPATLPCRQAVSCRR